MKARASPGASLAAALDKLGIQRDFDLVLHLPMRYDDETRLYKIAGAPRGLAVLVEGVVVESAVKFRPKRQLVCSIEDDSGVLVMRFPQFYTSQMKQLAPGTRVRLYGEIRDGFFGAEMVHPRYRVVRADTPLSKTLTPVYPDHRRLKPGESSARRARCCQRWRSKRYVASERAGGDEAAAIRRQREVLHYPPQAIEQAALQERTHPAWRRVKFDELLAQQLSMRIHYDRRKTVSAPPLRPRDKLTRALLAALPFELTRAQLKAASDIRRDLATPHPTQRLLQGDVGSGKTVVAALAALQALENGYQVAVMAPTEILAEQHFHKFSDWLKTLGVRIEWLTGSLLAKQKRTAP
jgi:ATP-dependent DNA helicase RecG